MAAIAVVVMLASVSASAELGLPLSTASPQPDAPLDLEKLLNLDELLNGDPVDTVNDVVDDTTQTVTGVLGGATDDTDVLHEKRRPPTKRPGAPAPQTDSWSTDRLLQAPGTSIVPATRLGARAPAPSYAAAVGDGLARAARRVAQLAGPVAAPMLLALLAIALLFVAARGPGRLVKVEEERKAFRDQRTFHL